MTEDRIVWTSELEARFDKANKQHALSRHLGDLYVNLLRCSRSSDSATRYDAAQSLTELLKTIALKPEIDVSRLIEEASSRVGWPVDPKDEPHRSLSAIAEAAITYLIEAAGYNHRRLLTKRTDKLVREIKDFNDSRRPR